MNNLYLDEETNKLFTDGEWLKSHKSNKILNTTIVDNGLILEPMPSVNKLLSLNVSDVAVLDKNNNYIPESGMAEMKSIDIKVPNNPKYIDKKVIWGGWLFFHYGHFLLQSTTRLYYYLKQEDKKYPIVFYIQNKNIPKFVYDFFSLCNIPLSDIIFIRSSTKFREITCPQSSSSYYKNWTDEFLLPFNIISKNVEAEKYEKVFFSRKYWNGPVKCLGEDILEKVFNKNGFKSIYMEKLTLKEQISIIKGAKVLAGINGTTFHNILFDNSQKELIILNRNEEFDSQYIINEARNAKSYIIKAYENPLPVSHPNGPFIVGITEHVCNFFKDYGINYEDYSFKPKKYLKKFLNIYTNIYNDENMYRELECRNKIKVETNELLYMLGYKSFNIYKMTWFYLLSKITFGKIRKNSKKKYKTMKKFFKKDIKFKY